MRKKKLAVVGAGNAGCITALNYHLFGKDIFDKIDIYYDPNSPIERVGQGTTPDVVGIINNVLNINWIDNSIKATFKTGILYENWGKRNDKILHKFPLETMSIHYVPNLLSKEVLNSGLFNVIEKDITNPESEIDSDYIFDCRGKSNNNPDDYECLINPLNSVILSKKEGKDYDLTYTKCVATPDGWTFVIPNIDSVSYGYLYNNTITSKEEASKNFTEIFDVIPGENFLFDNYLAKDAFVGERTILNGNRLSFLEPLEATSTGFYLRAANIFWDYIVNGESKERINDQIKNEMYQLETFILWHYQNGSKYDTKFWEYAKSLPFNPDNDFMECLEQSKEDFINLYKNSYGYGQWSSWSFKMWNEKI